MKRILYIILLFGLAGCKTLPKAPKGSEQLEQMRVDYYELQKQGLNNEIAKLNGIIEAKTNEIEALNKRMVKASNSNLGARLGVEFGTMETRTRDVVQNRIVETATLLPPPETGALEIELKRVKEELDTTRTSLEQLKANHASKVAELEAINAQYNEAVTKTATATAELEKVKETNKAKIEELTQETQNQAIKIVKQSEENDARAKEKADNDKRLSRVMYGVGIVLMLAGGAMVYLRHIMLSIICGCLSVFAICLGYFIPQLEPWIFWTAFSIGMLLVPIAMWIGYRRGLFQNPPEKVGEFTITK